MWFCGRGSGYMGASDAIFYATSSDGYNWSAAQQVLASTAAPEGALACDPSVVKVNGTFYMYYGTDSAQCRGVGGQIFMATSSDGVHWNKYPNNSSPAPIEKCTASNPCSTYCVGQPSVIYKDNKFIQYYTDTSRGVVFAASSTDGINFTPLNNNNQVYGGNYSVDVKYVPDLGIYFLAQGGGVSETRKYWSVSSDGINWTSPSPEAAAIVTNKPCNHNPGLLGDPTGMMPAKSIAYYGAGTKTASGDCWNPSTWDIDASDIYITNTACPPGWVSGCKVCAPDGSGWTDDNSKCSASQSCSNGACVANTAPKGYLDAADCNAFAGWTCDADSYSTPLTVHFYADGPAGSGTFIGPTLAGNARETAVGTQCGGNVNHGFSMATPASLKDGKSHSIYAYAINVPSGTNPLLIGNPKTIQCVDSCQTPNATRCAGNGVQTCGLPAGTMFGVPQWLTPVACSANQTCSNGTCIANCVPKTCATLGNYNCGSWSDGCGNTLSCGNCSASQTCQNGTCAAIPVTQVTISGKVTNDSNQGISGVTINLCDAAGSAVTDASGNWSKTVATGTSYCARIASGLPAGYSSIKGTNNNSCVANNASYEFQVAGQNVFTSCSAANAASWDLSSDSNINFVVTYPAACVPKTCSTLGNYNCGSWPDSCGNTLNCGACDSGKSCSSGTCAASCVTHSTQKCVDSNIYWFDSCGTQEDKFQDCGTDTQTANYQCANTWIQRQIVKKGCANGACFSNNVWNNDTDCAASNKICSNAACATPTTTCANQCVQYSTQCSGNGYQTCSDTNSDGCMEWSAVNDCPSNQSCVNGTCTTSTCVSNTTCSSLGYECGPATDGCGNTLNCGTCDPGSTCTGGTCVSDQLTHPTNTTHTDVLAKIAQIQALIADLQKQLAALGSPSSGTTANQSGKYSCTQITKNLYYGMKNDPQVKCLQEILKSQGYAVTASGNYDAATKTAVAQFQQKYAKEILAPYHLTRGSGNVGNATRGKINSFFVIK